MFQLYQKKARSKGDDLDNKEASNSKDKGCQHDSKDSSKSRDVNSRRTSAGAGIAVGGGGEETPETSAIAGTSATRDTRPSWSPARLLLEKGPPII